MQFRFPFLPAGICLTMAHLIENSRFSFFEPKHVLITLFRASTFRCAAFKWFLYLVLCMCNLSFINYALCQAFPVTWAVLALPAVAVFFFVFIESFGV